MTRAWVYGAGAVGCLAGGLLAAAGCPVVLVGRPALLEPVRARGLRLRTPRGLVEARPRVAWSAEEAAAAFFPDLVVVAVKAWATAAAAAELAAVARAGGRFVAATLQNGLGNEEALAAALGREDVWSGALTAAVAWAAPGEVAAAGNRGGLALTSLAWPGGPGPGREGPWRALLDAFRAGGFPAVPAPCGHPSLKWSKLLLNLLGNAVPAALDQPPAEALAHRDAFLLEREAFREACRVAAAEGARIVDLPGYPVRLLRLALTRLPLALSHRLLRRRLAAGRGEKLPSLLLDLRAGRRTEVAFLNGAVAARARARGVRAPVNAALADLLEALAAGTLPREEFRGRPDRLLAFVAARAGARS